MMSLSARLTSEENTITQNEDLLVTIYYLHQDTHRNSQGLM